MQLSHDGQSATPNQVVSGFRLRVALNSSGATSSPVAIYSNAGLSPANSFYYITIYAADGTEVVPGRRSPSRIRQRPLTSQP